MSISVSVPEELYKKAIVIAEAQHVSVDEVFASAFAEQLAVWERLQQRAALEAVRDFWPCWRGHQMSSRRNLTGFETWQSLPIPGAPSSRSLITPSSVFPKTVSRPSLPPQIRYPQTWHTS